MLLDHAIKLKWMPGPNPLHGMKMTVPESKAYIWERVDLDRVVQTCRREGAPEAWPVMAAMMLTQWEIGQRPTDLILFRRGEEYRNGTFRFRQSKTNSYVTIPISPGLASLLKDIEVKDSLYLFVDPRTGQPFKANDLSTTFRKIRGACLTKRKLTFRGLRHTCVVQLARAGCEIPEIASITGHSIQSVHMILQRYLPRDNVLAWSAQRKRGLIAADENESTSAR
jgi:integrase